MQIEGQEHMQTQRVPLVLAIGVRARFMHNFLAAL
jgi:hypothetical protein